MSLEEMLMEVSEAELEKKILYRLIKVAYFLFLIGLAIASTILGLITIITGFNSVYYPSFYAGPNAINFWEIAFVWIGGTFSSYFILNIIRETLLYVIFGKTFSWKWLFKNRPF